MIQKIKKHLSFEPRLICIIFSVVYLCSNIAIASAHSPHDVIDAIELSPTFEKDNTLFIIISDHLRKSTNGGFSWKELVNGLDHKHLLSSLAISPSFETDKTIFVSSEGDGIYRSTNGGSLWEKVNQGLESRNISLLAISPVDYDETVFAADSQIGLYKTTDGGESWVKVLDQEKITSLEFFPDREGNRVLAGDSNSNLLFSNNNGKTWKTFYKNLDAGPINSIVISPYIETDQTIFIGTENMGVFKTIDSGASFFPVNEGLPEKANIRSLSISPNFKIDKTILLSTWYEAAYGSNNGGKSWSKYDQGLTIDAQADTDQYRSPQFRKIKISRAFKKNRTIFLGGFDGLFRSTNGGLNWIQMETLPLSLIKGLAVSPGSSNYAIAITTYGGGAYVSQDKGNSWLICNKGLKTTRLSDIVFSPDYQKDRTLYSASKGVLLKSTDAGNNWQKTILNPKGWRHKAFAIARKLKVPYSWSEKILKKSERRKKWPTVITLAPNYAANKELYFATRYQGVFKFEDSGLKYSKIWDGLGRTITSMVMSPDFDNDGTLYASVRGLGIYKTQDKGKSWQPSNTGLSFLNEWQKSDTTHQIFKKDVKLALSPAYSMDHVVFAGSSEGLFKTTDAGKRWENLAHGQLLKNDYVIGLGISPNFKSDQTFLSVLEVGACLKVQTAGRHLRRLLTIYCKTTMPLSISIFHRITAATIQYLPLQTKSCSNQPTTAMPGRSSSAR